MKENKKYIKDDFGEKAISIDEDGLTLTALKDCKLRIQAHVVLSDVYTMKWIKFDLNKKRPSLKQDKLFLITDGKNYSIAFFVVDYHEDPPYFFLPVKNQKIIDNITHWMPLPEPPKEDE